MRSATNTPAWWGLLVLLKYRTVQNYCSAGFLAARLADKVAMGLTIMTLYWGVGGRFALDNYFNVAAVLFMWCMIPAFGAAAFVPSLVLERRLFVRERHDGLYRVATYLAAKMLDGARLVCRPGGCRGVFYAPDREEEGRENRHARLSH